MANTHYDIIIIGTGAAGGTLAHQLSSQAKLITKREQDVQLTREGPPTPKFGGSESGSPQTWGARGAAGYSN